MLKYDYKYAVVFADDKGGIHTALHQRQQEAMAFARAMGRMGARGVYAYNVERDDVIYESGDTERLPR